MRCPTPSRYRYVQNICRCEACTAAATEYHRQLTKKLRERSNGADPAVPHGTRGGYCNWGCRCAECSAVYLAATKKDRARRAARLAADPTIVEHGRNATYVGWGCRCEPCRAASAEYERTRPPRKAKAS